MLKTWHVLQYSLALFRCSSAWMKSVGNGGASRFDDLTLGIAQSVLTRSSEGFWLPTRGEVFPGVREFDFFVQRKTDFPLNLITHKLM